MPDSPARESSDTPNDGQYLSATLGGFASIGAGVVHALAAGIHAEHATLARMFAFLAVTQVLVGLVVVSRPSSRWFVVTLMVSTAAAIAWLYTRFAGISWITGLEVRESPQVVDTICATLAAIAAVCALCDLLYGALLSTRTKSAQKTAVMALILPAMWFGAAHTHNHSQAVAWPRAYDPAQPIDISGVPGVSAEQEARATQLIKDSQRDLPKWADVKNAVAQGWSSIGDSSTGFEHFINRRLIADDKFLDPTAPESLVYKVDGDKRTLVSAMFIANPTSKIDSPQLVDYAGPLMQWHVHNNLCWKRSTSGASVIAGITDANGNCPAGSVLRGIGIPMVHVWITPHQCGPFAALEGVGAGTAAVPDSQRADVCGVEHSH